MLHQDNLTTLQSHILQEAQRFPQATGQFSWILSAMSLATKVIASKIRRARIDDVLGALESSNVDIATEFTTMIKYQRVYSANARVISSVDQLVNELLALGR